MILTIALRELKNLFLSPLAWAILAVLQLVLAFVFLVQLESYMVWQARLAGIEGAPGVTDFVITRLFEWAGLLLLLISPAITMRSIAEEQRNRTLTLLMSAPVSISDIVLGKFLGITLFLLLFLLMITAMPLSLYSGTTPDTGKLLAGLLGLALLAATFTAIGLFMSSLTEQPVVAAISTLGLLLLLWIVDWKGESGENITSLIHYLSLKTHLNAFLKGIFSTRDLVYYLLLIGTFLMLAVRRLDQKRLTG